MCKRQSAGRMGRSGVRKAVRGRWLEWAAGESCWLEEGGGVWIVPADQPDGGADTESSHGVQIDHNSAEGGRRESEQPAYVFLARAKNNTEPAVTAIEDRPVGGM